MDAVTIGDEKDSAEGERLRFEGDLDKWMKILGAGISGYQPEAYAVMDGACQELVKLRSVTTWPVAWIETGNLAKLFLDEKPQQTWLFKSGESISGTPRTPLYAGVAPPAAEVRA